MQGFSPLAVPVGQLVGIEQLVRLAVTDKDHAGGMVEKILINVGFDRGVYIDGRHDRTAVPRADAVGAGVHPVEHARLVQNAVVVVERGSGRYAPANRLHEPGQIGRKYGRSRVARGERAIFLRRHSVERAEILSGIECFDNVAVDAIDCGAAGQEFFQVLQ